MNKLKRLALGIYDLIKNCIVNILHMSDATQVAVYLILGVIIIFGNDWVDLGVVSTIWVLKGGRVIL